MNKKNFNLFLVFGVLIIILLGVFVLATLTTVTLVTPAANENITGTNYTFNATITGTSADNVTFYHNQSGSFVQFCINTSIGAGPFTCVNNTANLPEGVYYFNATARNNTDTVTDLSASVTVDNTAPAITLPTYTNLTAKKNTATLTLNISVIDATSGLTGSACIIDVNGTNQTLTHSGGWCNSTSVDLTNLGDGNSVITVYANDTVNILGLNNSLFVLIDTTAPSVSLTKTSGGQTSLELSISGVDGTCTVDRSGATLSGSTVTEIGLSCGNSYAYIVTCTDAAGNAGSSSATSFSTTGCSSGGTTSAPKPKKASYSFSKITPGVAAVLKNFDAEIGVKEIKIEVNNQAQSVSITVTKSDGKPAAVSVAKTGKVYKYIQIEATNLADEFGKATVTLQVEKSWLSSNGLDANEIALFRFGESSEWNELATTYTGSEGDNELYEVELTSFSFFAISEKEEATVGEVGEEGIVEDDGETEKERSSIWWKVLILVLVILIIYVVMNREKYGRLLKQ